jgi:hypothetical protein
MRLAFDTGVEPSSESGEKLSAEHVDEVRRSAISLSLQPFTRTKYFESELLRHSLSKARARKTPDS